MWHLLEMLPSGAAKRGEPFLMEDQKWFPIPRDFFSWKGRIGPRRYFVGCLAIGLIVRLASIASFLAFGGAGQPLNSALIVVGLVSWSSLMTQRFHDIGLSATGPLIAFVSWSVIALAMADFQSSILGGFGARLLKPLDIDERGLLPFFLTCTVVLLVLHCFLFAKRGQQGLNRFGPPSP